MAHTDEEEGCGTRRGRCMGQRVMNLDAALFSHLARELRKMQATNASQGAHAPGRGRCNVLPPDQIPSPPRTQLTPYSNSATPERIQACQDPLMSICGKSSWPGKQAAGGAGGRGAGSDRGGLDPLNLTKEHDERVPLVPVEEIWARS